MKLENVGRLGKIVKLLGLYCGFRVSKREALKKPVKLVTLSKKVGRGQDQITIFSHSKIVTCLIGGGVCSSNVTISFSTFYGILRL